MWLVCYVLSLNVQILLSQVLLHDASKMSPPSIGSGAYDQGIVSKKYGLCFKQFSQFLMCFKDLTYCTFYVYVRIT